MTTKIVMQRTYKTLDLEGGPGIRLREEWAQFAGIKPKMDIEVAQVLGRHGPAIVIFSPEYQKQYRADQLEREQIEKQE